MDEQIRILLEEALGRAGTHFVDQYFSRRFEEVTIKAICNISEDVLLSSWISMNTVIKIRKFQIEHSKVK